MNYFSIYNGYEKELFKGISKRQATKFTFSVIGTIYPEQNIQIAIDAIRMFIKKYSLNEDFQFNFIGTAVYSELKNKIENQLNYSSVIITERVPREQALSIMVNSHILFHCGWPTHIGISSGKIYEYIAAGPSVLIAPNDFGVMEKIISETGSGFVANSSEEMLTVLVNMLIESNDYVQYFHYFPEFKEQNYRDKLLESESYSLLFQLKDKITAQIYTKLAGSPEKYNEFLWRMYDAEVSNRLKPSDVLIAWPQVSLKTMKKQKAYGGKILLEYPMIHVSAWQQQMKSVYSKLDLLNSKNVFNSSIEKKMLEEINFADKINVLSSYAKKTFIENGVNESKLSVVAPYVSDKSFFINEHIAKEDKFTFLFVGRIDILKGAHLLLEAFHKANIKNSQLLLVGHLSHEIKKYFEMYSIDVKHLPYQNHNQLQILYNSSHVLVLPSIQESFGMVCIEAMLCGLPVIVSSNTVAYDIVSGNNGLVFSSGNTEELIASCIKLHENYTDYKSNVIRESAHNKFNKVNYSLKYQELLNSI